MRYWSGLVPWLWSWRTLRDRSALRQAAKTGIGQSKHGSLKLEMKKRPMGELKHAQSILEAYTRKARRSTSAHSVDVELQLMTDSAPGVAPGCEEIRRDRLAIPAR